MDFNKSFLQSFSLLRKNLNLVLPFLFAQIFFYLMIISLLYASGFMPVSISVLNIYQDYNEYVSDEYDDGNFFVMKFEDYLMADEGFKSIDFEGLFTIDLFFICLAFFVIWYLISSFFINIGYYQNSKTLKVIDAKISFWDSCFKSLEYLGKFVGLKLSLLVVIYLPVVVVWGVVGGLFMRVPIVAGLLMIPVFIGSFAWLIFVSLKVFFASSILFLEDGVDYDVAKKLSFMDAIKFSFRSSRGRLSTIVLIALVIYGVSTLINYVAGQPLSSLFIQLFLSNSIIGVVFTMLFIVVFMILMSVLSCFLNLFMLRSYISFRSKNENIN